MACLADLVMGIPVPMRYLGEGSSEREKEENLVIVKRGLFALETWKEGGGCLNCM